MHFPWTRREQSQPDPESAETDQDRFVEIEKRYRVAERDFNEACASIVLYNRDHKDPRIGIVNGEVIAAVNAGLLDPERQRLEGIQSQALERRNHLLQRRAQLMKELGLIR